MANFRTVIVADTAGTQVVTAIKPRSLTEWFATFNAYGTFGGGTLSYALSTDGGATLVPMKDISGTLYTTTGNDAVNVTLGVGNHNDADLRVYAVLSGSTSPSITIDIYDNR